MKLRYWLTGTWVFDEPSKGLDREPLICEIPEMINDMTRDIPNSRQAFRPLPK